MSAYDILVKVGGDITGFSKSMENASKSLKGFTKENAETFDAFKKTGAVVTGAGIAIAGGLGLAVNEASNFQSAFAGVKKTVDSNAEGYAILEKGIRDMAKELPATATEIAGVAESAGQLGIAEGNILDFTRTMIDLGEATNLTANEAATQFARFANITKMPQDAFDKLGSVVVDLGNNLATTEAEIVDMSMRLAAQGKQVGMTEAEIMALAGTMSSLGISSEAGGTAMTMVFTKMQKAVMDGGEDLDAFAKAAGVSSKEFAESFSNDPVKALETLASGLGTSAEAGGNMSAILEELGISGIREADVMKRLAGNSELLGKSVAIANGAWDENSALTNEAAQRYETFESKMSMFKNAVKDVGITIGNVLLPFVTTLVEKLSGVMDWVSQLNPTFLKWATIITAVVAALALIIGPILLLIGFIPALLAGFAAVKVVFLAVGAALGTISAPVLIVIGVVAALIAIFVALWKTNEGFRDAILEIWERIKEGFTVALEFIKEIVTTVITAVWDFIKEMLGKIKAVWDNHGESIMAVVSGAFKNIWEYIKLIMGYIKGLFQIVWPIISGIIKIAWGVIKTVIRQTMDVILGIIDAVMYLIKGDWEGAWNSIKKTAVKIMLNIIKFFEEIDLKQIGKDIINGLIKGIGSMFGAVGTAVKNIATNVKDTVTKFFGINSPSRLFTGYGVNLGEGLALGIDGMKGVVAKSAKALSESATIKPDLSYATPNANYGSLSAALSGEVNVNQRDSALIGAINELRRDMTNLTVEMDGQTVGVIVAPTVSESINAQADGTTRGRGRRRI